MLLAFGLLPSYEKFKDKRGNEVDVAPGAPPMPEWLRPTDETTGNPTGYEYQDWLNKESYPLPQSGMDYVKESFANWFVSPIRETYVDGDGEDHDVELPQSTTVTALPPPTTVSSNKRSGVRTLPSQSMPPNIGPIRDTLNATLPAPDFSKGGTTEKQNRYVLKSSLVPCTCATRGGGPSCAQHAGSYPGSSVPGSMNEDEEIKKPFSVAFAGETNPVGYLNSFAAFSK
jgi:hypothetical protein